MEKKLLKITMLCILGCASTVWCMNKPKRRHGYSFKGRSLFGRLSTDKDSGEKEKEIEKFRPFINYVKSSSYDKSEETKTTVVEIDKI